MFSLLITLYVHMSSEINLKLCDYEMTVSFLLDHFVMTCVDYGASLDKHRN